MMASQNISTNSTGFSYHVQFHYQSEHVNFAEWISLTTLCLTPLVAHLFVGTPQPVYLHHSRPKWHEHVVHYNPTAIIWRYFAITDRRIRARNWNPVDMAAGNALFWTDHGWDGSEDMMIRSRALCMQTPPSTLSRLFSTDTLKTTVVALQGTQAIYLLTGRSVGTITSGTGFAIDTIFMPVAVVGLLRLFAALWLTDNRLFKSEDHDDETEFIKPLAYETGHNYSQLDSLPTKTDPSLVTLRRMSQGSTRGQFHPVLSVGGIGVRALYTSFLIFFLGVTLSLMYAKLSGILSATTFFMGYFYTTFLIITTGIFLRYFLTGRSNSSSTVIPCITSTWFKVYTGYLYLCLFTLFVLAALETRRMPCGLYTTFQSQRDQVACSGLLGS